MYLSDFKFYNTYITFIILSISVKKNFPEVIKCLIYIRHWSYWISPELSMKTLRVFLIRTVDRGCKW